MGTNYYAETDCCSACGRPDGRIHIGKSSAGWAFLFMPHTSLALTTWKEWKAFLQKPDVRITDEYGEPMSLEYLAECVEAKKGLLTHETASDQAWGPYDRDGYMDEDGYRFSVEREFS